MAGVVELLDAGTEYYTAVQTIIPLAATSEVHLHRRSTTGWSGAPGDPPAATFLLGFDSLPIRAEKSLYELAGWTRERPALAAALLAAMPSAELVGLLHDDKPMPDVDPEVWREWRARFQRHLDRFGHTVYNLDFANAVPADDPAPLIDTLRFYLRGEGTDPNERQAGSAARRERATRDVAGRLDPARRAVFGRLLRWAQGIAPVREDALGDVGLAWPQLRRMLLELGRRLVGDGVIGRPEDVFWLRREEILAAPTDRSEAVARRKETWRGRRRATPPQLLPERGWYRVFENMMPAVSHEQTGNVLSGIGASAGRVTAPARVLDGPADFGRMRSGDVLVASITTPAWTPAVRDGVRSGHRHRRAAEPQLDRGPRVRHPGRARHRGRHPADTRRVDDHGGRRRRHRHPARRHRPGGRARSDGHRPLGPRPPGPCRSHRSGRRRCGDRRLASPPRPPPLTPPLLTHPTAHFGANVHL